MQRSRTTWVTALLLTFPGTAIAGPEITIQGGSDATAHNYKWTISHNHAAPLVYVEMPHFRADFFNAPDGWTSQLINQNSLDLKPGLCIARANDESTGLRRGERAVFSLRVNPAEALRGKAMATFRFADGVEVTQMMELPVKPSSFEQWALPAALAGMFAVYVAVQSLRKGKKRPTTP